MPAYIYLYFISVRADPDPLSAEPDPGENFSDPQFCNITQYIFYAYLYIYNVYCIYMKCKYIMHNIYYILFQSDPGEKVPLNQ